MFSVPAQTIFSQLQIALQIAFQWNKEHLWKFFVKDTTAWTHKNKTSHAKDLLSIDDWRYKEPVAFSPPKKNADVSHWNKSCTFRLPSALNSSKPSHGIELTAIEKTPLQRSYSGLPLRLRRPLKPCYIRQEVCKGHQNHFLHARERQTIRKSQLEALRVQK